MNSGPPTTSNPGPAHAAASATERKFCSARAASAKSRTLTTHGDPPRCTDICASTASVSAPCAPCTSLHVTSPSKSASMKTIHATSASARSQRRATGSPPAGTSTMRKLVLVECAEAIGGMPMAPSRLRSNAGRAFFTLSL
jgi:hypothetical protein